MPIVGMVSGRETSETSSNSNENNTDTDEDDTLGVTENNDNKTDLIDEEAVRKLLNLDKLDKLFNMDIQCDDNGLCRSLLNNLINVRISH